MNPTMIKLTRSHSTAIQFARQNKQIEVQRETAVKLQQQKQQFAKECYHNRA
jgi:hypothetical protein